MRFSKFLVNLLPLMQFLQHAKMKRWFANHSIMNWAVNLALPKQFLRCLRSASAVPITSSWAEPSTCYCWCISNDTTSKNTTSFCQATNQLFDTSCCSTTQRVHGRAPSGKTAGMFADQDDSPLDIRRSRSPQRLRNRQVLLAKETDEDYYDNDIEPGDERLISNVKDNNETLIQRRSWD